MPPQPPVFLVDNLFDRINLYPLAVLSSSGAVAGREVQYVADYRRERTCWQAAAVGISNQILTDLGAGQTATPDTIWLDRGHNLWGKSVQVAGDDGFGGSAVNALVPTAVPAQGTVGGDPTAGWCVTEEGALYAFLPNPQARRRWIVNITDSWAPVITGVILGTRIQMLNYSSVRDEDAGERSNRVEKSLVPGYEGRDRTYARRTITVRLSTIGAAEYDSSIRSLRRLLFEIDEPALVIMNYGDKPERAWLYQYEGANWSSPMVRVLRDLGLSMSEVGPLIR